jgi:hypothetical protein
MNTDRQSLLAEIHRLEALVRNNEATKRDKMEILRLRGVLRRSAGKGSCENCRR